jgi:cardiolipin synthase
MNSLCPLCGTPLTFVTGVEKVGIQVYRYKNGLMHQKVMLLDALYWTIGTANFDNCSAR